MPFPPHNPPSEPGLPEERDSRVPAADEAGDRAV